jgi:hypothetical protein
VNLHHLADFLRGDLAPNGLLNEINAEVSEYRAAFRKKGSSRPIFVTEDTLEFLLGRQEIKRLCSLFLQGIVDECNCSISLMQLTYLRHSLFTMRKYVMPFFQLADPEVNLPLNTTNVAALCEGL